METISEKELNNDQRMLPSQGQKGYSLPQEGFVRLREVLTVIPIGKTCWWEGVKSGRFPKPVKLSARCTAWRAEDIRALMASLSRAPSGH